MNIKLELMSYLRQFILKLALKADMSEGQIGIVNIIV